MAAFFEARITCDHPGCKAEATATFEIRYGVSESASIFMHKLPEGWDYKTSWFVIDDPYRCPEHNK